MKVCVGHVNSLLVPTSIELNAILKPPDYYSFLPVIVIDERSGRVLRVVSGQQPFMILCEITLTFVPIS